LGCPGLYGRNDAPHGGESGSADALKGSYIFPPKRKEVGMKAWVLTWESENRELPGDKVIAVLNSRWGTKRVSEAVELFFAEHIFKYDDKIAHAKYKNFNPYKPSVSSGPGMPVRIMCGYNPYIEARVVDNIRVIEGRDGKYDWEWDEPVVDVEENIRVKRLVRERGG
jgi:hypothetical protein